MPRPRSVLLAFHWYLESLHQGAVRYGMEHGMDCTVLTTDSIPSLAGRRFDGVVGMLPPMPHPVHRFVRDSGLPTVELSLAYSEMKDWVRCPEDCDAIALIAAGHLQKKPVRSFAFASHGRWWNHDLRESRFREALKNDARPVRTLCVVSPEGPAAARARVAEALREMPLPIAVFGSVDSAAKIIVDAALDAGLRVPEDVVVLGFGNRELESLWTPVPITSIDIDYEDWAWKAMSLLDGLLAGTTAPGAVVAQPPGILIERRSSGLAAEPEKICLRALEILKGALAKPPSVAELARRAGVSKSTLERAFDREFGCGVARKSLSLRIDHAKALLAGGMKTEAVAKECGFRSYRAFVTAFRRVSGVTPGGYADR